MTTKQTPILRRMRKVVLILACMIALLFLPAGRWDWWEGWIFLTAYLVFVTALFLWLRKRDPNLYAERTQTGPNVKKWDKILISIYTLTLITLFVVASLDSGRFQWSVVPTAPRVAGWIGLVFSAGLIWWVMATNTFLSGMVRIQKERGHNVITGGPYHYVRHPMYSGIMICFVCVPPVLGSWWAMIPAVVIDVLFILRTALEDRTLRQELDGYQAYAGQVRFRLIPGVW